MERHDSLDSEESDEAPAPGPDDVVWIPCEDSTFPFDPVRALCPYCRKIVVTSVEDVFMWCRFLTCILCSFLLILAGSCAMSSKNCSWGGRKHHCPECGEFLAWHK